LYCRFIGDAYFGDRNIISSFGLLNICKMFSPSDG
jgi:hypothetical protein